MALRLATALQRFWDYRGYVREGRDWLEKPLAKRGSATIEIQAQALNAAGWLTYRQGDLTQARLAIEESLQLFQAAEEEIGLAEALQILAVIEMDQGEYPTAQQRLEQSLSLCRTLHYERGIARGLQTLGAWAWDQDRIAEARDYYQERLQRYQRVGDQVSIANLWLNVGDTERLLEDVVAAHANYEACLKLARALGHVGLIGAALKSLGMLAFKQQTYIQARNYGQEALRIFRELGDKSHIGFALCNLGDVARKLGESKQALAYYCQSLQIMHEVGYKWPTFEQVSFNDTNAAASDMGYRFVPAPAQPTKRYTVTVDSSMQSVGFLLTGYNGTFAPLTVRTPAGAAVVCNTEGMLCVTVGLVQYVQVNVNGRTGLWTVDVQPGPSGAGTFAFSSMAAGPLPVTSPSDRTLPAFEASVLHIDLGQPVDNNRLTAQFLTPANLGFGQPFVFFDDGAHSDGVAGAGRFGSDPFQPAQNGAAYLWVDGALNGQPFRRVEPKPFSFQPLRLAGPDAAPSLAAKTVVSYTLTNHDAFAHTFRIDVQTPPGWRGQLDLPGDGTLQVGAGLSRTFPVAIWMGATDQEALNQPSGTRGTVNIAAIEAEQGARYDSAALEITRHRPPAHIEIHNLAARLPIHARGQLKFTVVDDQNFPVVDGTRLALNTTLGSLPVTVTTQAGSAAAEFVAGNQPGIGLLTAQTAPSVIATTTSGSRPIASTIATFRFASQRETRLRRSATWIPQSARVLWRPPNVTQKSSWASPTTCAKYTHNNLPPNRAFWSKMGSRAKGLGVCSGNECSSMPWTIESSGCASSVPPHQSAHGAPGAGWRPTLSGASQRRVERIFGCAG